VHLTGMHLTGMHLTSMHLTGVHLVGISQACISQACISFWEAYADLVPPARPARPTRPARPARPARRPHCRQHAANPLQGSFPELRKASGLARAVTSLPLCRAPLRAEPNHGYFDFKATQNLRTHRCFRSSV
jgi:hypothetical protein